MDALADLPQTPAVNPDPLADLPTVQGEIMKAPRRQAAVEHANELAGYLLAPERAGRPAPIGQSTPLLTTDPDGTYRVSGGDEGAKEMARQATEAYRGEFRQRFPDLAGDADRYAQTFQKEIEQQYRQFQLKTIHDSVINTNQVGVGSRVWAATSYPIGGYIADAMYHKHVNDAAERFNKGEATADDYGWLAHYQASQDVAPTESWQSKIADRAVGGLRMAAEWSMMPGMNVLGEGGALAAGAGGGAVGKALLGAGGKLLAGAGARTASQIGTEALANKIGGGSFTKAPLPEGLSEDQYGNLAFPKGAPESKIRDLTSRYLSNVLFEGSGVLSPEASGFGKRITNFLMTSEADADIQKILGNAPAGGNFSQLLASIKNDDPEMRANAIRNIMTDAVSGGAMEAVSAGLDAYQRRGYSKPVSEKKAMQDFLRLTYDPRVNQVSDAEYTDTTPQDAQVVQNQIAGQRNPRLPAPDAEYYQDLGGGMPVEEAKGRLLTRQPPETPTPAPEKPADPRQELIDAMGAKGLTAREQHVILERAQGRSHDDIRKDDAMGRIYSRQRIKQIEQDALDKMGVDWSMEHFNARTRAESASESPAAAQELGIRQPITAEEKAAARRALAPLNPHEQAAKDLAHLADKILARKEDGPLSPDEREAFGRRADEIHRRAQTTARPSGANGAPENTERAAGEPTPVRRADTSTETPVAPNEAVTGSAGRGEGAATVPEAAGNVVAPENDIPPGLKDQLKKLVAGGERTLVDDIKDELKAQGFSDQAIKDAVKEAGKFPEGVQGKVGPSTFRGNPRQAEGGMRKYLTQQMVLGEMMNHEIDKARAAGASESAIQEIVRNGEAAGLHNADQAVRPQPLPPEIQGSPGSFDPAKLESQSPRASESIERGGWAGATQRLVSGESGTGGAFWPIDLATHVMDYLRSRPEAPLAKDDPGVSENVSSGLAAAAARFAAEEHGFANLDVLTQKAKDIRDSLVNTYKSLRDSWIKLGGGAFPETKRNSPETAADMHKFDGSSLQASLKAAQVIDQMKLGDLPPETAQRYQETQQEMRQRFAKQQHMDRSQDASIKAAQARVNGNKEEAKKQADIATDEMKKGQAVATHIGAQNSQLPDEATFQRTLQEPGFKQFYTDWEKYVVPHMNELYSSTQGLDENDPIDSFTQMPGHPIPFMRSDPSNPTATTVNTGPARGNLKNVKLFKNPFSNEAHLSGTYETDPKEVISNLFQRSQRLANKADWLRNAADSGRYAFSKPGQKDLKLNGQDTREIPFVSPPKGTQPAEPGQTSLYVPKSEYSEVRQLLGVDEPVNPGPWRQFSDALTKGSLLSTVEAAYHSKNLISNFFTQAGWNPLDLVSYSMQKWSQSPDLVQKAIELANIGVGREASNHGLFGGGKLDPTSWGGKFLHLVDEAARFSADKAFDRNVAKGNFEDTPANRADFINSAVGNYSKLSQSKLVAFLRDAGIGPFATAGANYLVNSFRQLTATPSIKTTGLRGEAQYRAETIARTAAVLGSVVAANLALWGRWDGDDKTPLGAIKIGEKDGKSQSLNLTNWLTGLPRGARETGLMALGEGLRRGETGGQIADKAQDNMLTALIHPAFGPGAQFVHTFATGKNSLGMTIAKKAQPSDSQAWNNLKAALSNANPVYSSLSGSDRAKPAPMDERLMQLLGPFGVQSKGTPKPVYRRVRL